MFNLKPGSTVLCCFAHPDDAELTCFGTLALLLSHGARIHILHATNGERTNGGLATDRQAHAQAAANVIGAETHSLGLPDGFLQHDMTTISEFDKWVTKLRPTVVITHTAQQYGRGHQDHEVVSLSASNSALRHSFVHWLLHAEPPVSSTGFEPNLVVDITEHLPIKMRAIAQYLGEADKEYMQLAAVQRRGAWWAHQARQTNDASQRYFEAFRLISGVIRETQV